MENPKETMNDYWHIPRASLASSSTASSSASSLASSSNRSNRSTNSNPPTIRTTIKSRNDDINDGGRQNGRNHKNNNSNPPRIHQTIHEKSLLKVPATATAEIAGTSGAKRGSRSSQGSSGSNNSTRSAASGSLLLTAANLERFAEIHKKQTKSVQKQQQEQQKFYLNEEQLATTLSGLQQERKSGKNYNANLAQALATGRQLGYGYCGNEQDSDIVCITQANKDGAGNHKNDDTIIAIDPNLDFVKSKDLDTVSIASSMHFTMVNGEGGPPKKPKRGLCDRGRQVTVLIVSMSTIFLLLIMGMVYALEMRARDMPQS